MTNLKFKIANSRMSLVVLLFILILLPIIVISVQKYQSYKSGASTGPSTLAISPINTTTPLSQSGTVNIFLDPMGANVSGVEVYLNYDSNLLTINSISPGPFFTNNAATIGNPLEIIKNTSGGQIHYALAFPLGSNYGSTIAGNVATITYTTKAAGTSNLTFVTTGLMSTTISDVNAQNAFGSATNGVITITQNSSPSPTPTSNPTKIGDTNSDGSVDIIDIGILIDNYGKNPIPNINADINKDDIVNIIDIGIVVDNYGK